MIVYDNIQHYNITIFMRCIYASHLINVNIATYEYGNIVYGNTKYYNIVILHNITILPYSTMALLILMISHTFRVYDNKYIFMCGNVDIDVILHEIYILILIHIVYGNNYEIYIYMKYTY